MSERISPDNGESQGFSKEDIQRLREVAAMRTLRAYKDLAVDQNFVNRKADISGKIKEDFARASFNSTARKLGKGLLECIEDIRIGYSETTTTQCLEGKIKTLTEPQGQRMERISSFGKLPVNVVEEISTKGVNILLNTRKELGRFQSQIPDKEGTRGISADMQEYYETKIGRTLLSLVDEAKSS